MIPIQTGVAQECSLLHTLVLFCQRVYWCCEHRALRSRCRELPGAGLAGHSTGARGSFISPAPLGPTGTRIEMPDAARLRGGGSTMHVGQIQWGPAGSPTQDTGRPLKGSVAHSCLVGAWGPWQPLRDQTNPGALRPRPQLPGPVLCAGQQPSTFNQPQSSLKQQSAWV